MLRKRRAGASFTRSDLEELFLRLADRTGLPRPDANVMIEGFEVDCVWREQRLVVEVDGWATHGTRVAFERDREKSRIFRQPGGAACRSLSCSCGTLRTRSSATFAG